MQSTYKKSEKSTAFNVIVVCNLELPRHFATQRLDLVQTSINILSFWQKKLYVQTCYSLKPFLFGFVTFCSKTCIRKYIKQFST